MNISIEFLVIIILLLFSFLCFLWYYISLKINKRRYKEENDKGRRFQRPERRDNKLKESKLIVEGIAQSGKHTILQTAEINNNAVTTSDDGKTSNSYGEVIKPRRSDKPRRNPFRRR